MFLGWGKYQGSPNWPRLFYLKAVVYGKYVRCLSARPLVRSLHQIQVLRHLYLPVQLDVLFWHLNKSVGPHGILNIIQMNVVEHTKLIDLQLIPVKNGREWSI